jgi:hypothetical protein
MGNGKKQSQKRKTARKERPAKGRKVYIGQRPKMPLIIAGIFIAGLVMIILATLFSPKKSDTPPAPQPPASTNAVPAAAASSTNAPTAP